MAKIGRTWLGAICHGDIEVSGNVFLSTTLGSDLKIGRYADRNLDDLVFVVEIKEDEKSKNLLV